MLYRLTGVVISGSVRRPVSENLHTQKLHELGILAQVSGMNMFCPRFGADFDLLRTAATCPPHTQRTSTQGAGAWGKNGRRSLASDEGGNPESE